jgi:hypothetical protein
MSGYFNLGKNLYKGFQKVFDASRSSSTPKNLRGTMSTTIVAVKPNVPTTKLEKAKSKLAIAKQKAKTSTLKLKNTLSDLKEKVTKREKKMGGGMMGRRFGMKKGSKFPDLTGDGKVTQADILKGRGVFSKGGGADTGKLGELRSKLGVVQNKIKRKTERLKKLKSARDSLTGKRGVDI